MFRLIGNFNGKEYQQQFHDFSDAYKVLQNSKRNANFIKMMDCSGKIRAIYLKHLGTSLTI